MPTTTERILDAAELLFARHGVDSTSLRAITAEAGVNTAAIHYHFGSRDALLEEVLSRRIAPLNQERLKQLERLEMSAGEGVLPIEALLAAFLLPVVEVAELGERARSLAALIAAMRMEEPGGLRHRVTDELRRVKQCFAAAACRGRTDLGVEEATERLDYCLGAMGHLLVTRSWEASAPLDPASLLPQVERMIAFLAAGFRVPARCEGVRR